tara:strand:- start:166 stop:987 length:822 start_codon:yes stop_codon:yes gene_type:complete
MKFNCGITGHTGVLGSEFIKKHNTIEFIKFYGDIANKKNVKNWLVKKNINIIFHLAAIVPTQVVKKNPKKANKINYLGTKILIDELIKLKKIKWFFFSSTSHVYKFSQKRLDEKSRLKPSSLYGLTKLKAEKYIQKKLKKEKIPFCIGRIFSFTHKKQTADFVIPSIIKKAKSKKKIVYFENTEHYRDFLSTGDICNAINILFKKKANGIYNIGSGKKVLISDIIKLIFKKYKKIYKISKNNKSTWLIADINKIKKFKWKPKNNIISIVNELT